MSLHQQNLTKAIHGQRPKQVKKRITLKTKSSPKLCKFLLLHNKCFPLEPAAGCLLLEVYLDHIFFPFKPLQLTYTYSGLVLRRSGGKLRRGCLMFILQSQANASFVSLQISGQPILRFLHWRRELLPSVLLIPHWGNQWRQLGSVSWAKSQTPGPCCLVGGCMRRQQHGGYDVVTQRKWKPPGCSEILWHLDNASTSAQTAVCEAGTPFLVTFFAACRLNFTDGVFPMDLHFRAPFFMLPIGRWLEKRMLSEGFVPWEYNFYLHIKCTLVLLSVT